MIILKSPEHAEDIESIISEIDPFNEVSDGL